MCSSWRRLPRPRKAVAVFHLQQQQQRQLSTASEDKEGVAAEAETEEEGGVASDWWPLQLTLGDVLTVEASDDAAGWLYGRPASNPGLGGLFPRAYVRYLDHDDDDDGHAHKHPAIVHEISSVLREWNAHLRQRFLAQDADLIALLRAIMREVLTMRTSLMSGKLTLEEARETQRKVTTKMDFLNHRLGLDLVVRDERGDALCPERTSAVALFRQHVRASEKIDKMMLTKPREETEASNAFKIMMAVKNFVSTKVVDDVDLILSIYEASATDTKTPKPLCESYIVRSWSRTPANLELRSNLRVLFADISKNDITNKRLFLICHVVAEGSFGGRAGSMGGDELNKSASRVDLRGSISGGAAAGACYRKPVGVAAAEITDLFTFKQGKSSEGGGGGRETELSAAFLPGSDNEPFESVFRKLVFERKAGDTKNLWVTLNIMMGDLNTPTPMDSLPLRHSLPCSGASDGKLAIARKIGLPEVILPSDFRNDLYVTLVSGELSRLEKRSDRNVEVCVEVCDEQGRPVPESISGGVGAGADSQFRSVVFYHEGKPRWNEVTKVALPVDLFLCSHLRFTFTHRSSNASKDKSAPPWAMAFLKLVNDHDKTAVRDGQHELLVYKMEKHFRLGDGGGDGAACYLDMPYLKCQQYHLKQKTTHNLTVIPKDVLTVQTTLCSTKLTQNEGLLSLLKWSSEKERLRENLSMFHQKVNVEEFVKFLPDVLDALFTILTDNQDSETFDNQVFRSLIKVIRLITRKDSRYQQFVPILDMYILENFSATLAYNKLLVALKECADSATTKPKEVEQTMESMRYVFKFVVRSRTLFSKMNGGKGREPFEQLLRNVLQGLAKTMLYTSEDLLEAQRHCLANMVHSIPELVTVFDRKSLTEIIVYMVHSLPRGQLVKARLDTLKDLVHSQLFAYPECRAVVLPEMSGLIRDLLEKAAMGGDDAEDDGQLMQSCTETLGDALDALARFESERPGSADEDVRHVMLRCLRPVIQSVAGRRKDDPNVPAVVANMVALLGLMTPKNYEQYIGHFNADEPAGRLDLIDFVMEVLGMFRDLVQNRVFPADWTAMVLVENGVLLRALRHLADTIRDRLTSPFEYQAWSNFFQCSVTFVAQPALQLERFSENKRCKVQLQAGQDMRKDMARVVTSMWYSLGQHKIRFVPEMVGPFLEITLLPETELRKETLPIFFDMMQCEYYSSRFRTEDGDSLDTRRDPTMNKGNFRDFEKEIVTKLDAMIEVGAGDEHYRALFRQILHGRCEAHTALREPGTRLVRLVARLMELLLEYRTIKQEDSRENQMSCLVNLIDFYQSIRCDELYIKYLKRLCSLHEQCENWAEAALTVLQYTEMLAWADYPLRHAWKNHAGCRTHRALKEQLYRDAVRYFEKGKMWEKAVLICKELTAQYEQETFEYGKLAELHKRMAGYYENVMTELRPEPEYFRVAFYGRGFPAFLQNRVFVYRGRGFERLPEFQSRLLDQFPNAELMKTLKAPSDDEKERPVQLLQINKVDPVMGETRFQGKFVQQHIVNYYKVNDVRKFTYSRPFSKGRDKDNEFATLWIERTCLQTKDTFPGVLQWFPLSQPEEVYELCPLENAVETMTKANDDLRALVLEHQHQNPPLNPLSMKLNGMIDAAVMGGIPKYEQAFFTDAYLEANPDHGDRVRALKDLIALQIPLLEVGIKIHGLKKSDDLKPLHDRLEGMFRAMRAQVEERYGKRTCDITVRSGYHHRRSVGSRQHLGQGGAGGNALSAPFNHSLELRSSITSQSSFDSSSLAAASTSSSSKSRVLSAIGIGITRKKSNASSSEQQQRGSLTRSSQVNVGGAPAYILENGNGYEHEHGAKGNNGTPTVLVTQTARLPPPPAAAGSRFSAASAGRPSSSQFAGIAGPATSTPNHSRSPSLNSNRDSLLSNDEGAGGAGSLLELGADAFPPPPPPPLPPSLPVSVAAPPQLPPKNRHSDPENTSLSSFDEENPAEREEIVTRHVIIAAAKKRAAPPPPTVVAADAVAADGATPPMPPKPPKKPPFKPPIE